jgi:DNA repair exonuclease SbcCD ATPase subunit
MRIAVGRDVRGQISGLRPRQQHENDSQEGQRCGERGTFRLIFAWEAWEGCCLDHCGQVPRPWKVSHDPQSLEGRLAALRSSSAFGLLSISLSPSTVRRLATIRELGKRSCQMKSHSSAALAGVMMFIAAIAPAQAQDEGVKQIQQLIKKANAQVEAIRDAKLQVQKTMEAYNAVLAPDAKDRRDAYKTLQKEMASSDKKRAEVATRSMELNVEADKLFKSWEGSTAAIQSPELKKRSEERLKRTQDRFTALRQTGQTAADLYAPMMKTLQDQVTYLGHDLNAGAASSLKADADKLNAQAKDLYAAVDKVTETANANIAKLSAE